MYIHKLILLDIASINIILYKLLRQNVKIAEKKMSSLIFFQNSPFVTIFKKKLFVSGSPI